MIIPTENPIRKSFGIIYRTSLYKDSWASSSFVEKNNLRKKTAVCLEQSSTREPLELLRL